MAYALNKWRGKLSVIEISLSWSSNYLDKSMTAWTTAQTPSNINTIEKLAMWALIMLEEINRKSELLESAGDKQYVITQYIYTDANLARQLLTRVNIPVASNILTDKTTKSWEKALELSTVAIPVAYTTN
jgi:ABC-type ATPase with predicted acetyltransferase domain